MKLQLCTTDEHGQMAIVQSGTDLQALIKRAKDEVQEVNINNSLTALEKKRNWEAMFVELLDPETGEVVEDAVYAGKDSTGQHSVTPLADSARQIKLASCDVLVRAYLGKLDGEDLYAEHEGPRGAGLITDIKHPALQNKVVYFIRKLG